MADDEKEGDKTPPKKTLSLTGKTLSLGSAGAPARTRGGAVSAPSRRGAPLGPSVAVEVRRRRAGGENAGQDEALDKSAGTHALTDEERHARERALREAEETGDDGAPSLPARAQARPTVRSVPDSSGVVVAPPAPSSGAGDAQGDKDKSKGAFVTPRVGTDKDNARKGAPPPRRTTGEKQRGGGRITVTQAVNKDYERDRGQSLAAQKRAREKARLAASGPKEAAAKVVRDVIVPETITVQELAARMAEPAPAVIKILMKMGVMATMNQAIDADTAELVASEFGHKIRRVTDADVEVGLEGIEDSPDSLVPRAPVVTIMGHVDHGKTSLLDAMRATNVVGGEAGGITQHIGAYQVTLESGQRITFVDTPGHEAFTAMRARGATVTDIVVIVIAANDSIMPQTIEAIAHAKAANVPIIVAINKIDLPGADPAKIRQDLLQHDIQVEEMGGQTLSVEISAKKRLNLDKLQDAILLQAEILELAANPNRPADGVIIEAKQERGRGSVVTVLVRRGTLHVGDIFIAGAETGKVRALMDDKGQVVDEAIPGQPVEVLGLDGTPEAGDSLVVVNDEARAREVATYRRRKKREIEAALALKRRTTLEQLLARKEEGQPTVLPVVLKADVHGSLEAITSSLAKVTQDNVGIDIKVLHAGVGGITESDVTLARASNGLIIGFNVRAGTQARAAAQQAGVDVRYYNVIYDIIDDIKSVLSGMLAPNVREEILGHAQVREVFHVTKVGNVAGCMVTHGILRRGAKLRLLREDVVVYSSSIAALKRFKDDAKEVREGFECGVAIANYDGVHVGDILECFDMVEEARTVT